MFQEQDLEIKGMLFRIVDIFYLAEEVKEPLVLRMAVLKSLAFYDYEFFNFANSLINKCSSVVKTHLYYALFTINTVYYDKFKEAHLRRKCF